MSPKPTDSDDADEREIAALKLQRLDETEQDEIDAAWDETITRRLDELVDAAESAADLILQWQNAPPPYRGRPSEPMIRT
ncbi:MAG: hypothetical protein L0H31_17275 [Nocardioidaceae bacterium]|nr:hypothetical protein [Nocardioidaceae bacterium]